MAQLATVVGGGEEREHDKGNKDIRDMEMGFCHVAISGQGRESVCVRWYLGL